jgi:hypothetical protein
MKKRTLLSWLALGAFLLTFGCTTFDDADPTTFAEAKALAATRGVPLLLDFFTEW